MPKSRKTIVRDKGYSRIRANVKRTNRVILSVGFHRDEVDRDDSELNVAEIALINEYGSTDGHVPERSFIRSTIDANNGKYRRQARREVAAAIMSKSRILPVYERLGIRIRDDIKRKIVSLRSPANAESTIRQKSKRGGKRKDNPLIDTGTMLNRVNYRIRKRA